VAALKIVIPTADRPASLRAVLDYYGRFYPSADVVVADGSRPVVRELNRLSVARAEIKVEHREYDEELPVFERLYRVVTDLDDAFVVLGADDNYPILETLDTAMKRLQERPAAALAGGHVVHLDVTAPDRASARLDPVRHINPGDPALRMRVFGSLTFPTTYSVTRRDTLVARLDLLRNWYLADYYELGVGLVDVIKGQYFAIPEIGFICTSNYVDNPPRLREPLAHLRGADQVLALHDAVLERASAAEGFDLDATLDVLTAMIRRQTAALAGAPIHEIFGFEDKAPYRTPIVDGARETFRDLFRPGTAEREKYGDKLAFIAERLQQITTSAANHEMAGAR